MSLKRKQWEDARGARAAEQPLHAKTKQSAAQRRFRILRVGSGHGPSRQNPFSQRAAVKQPTVSTLRLITAQRNREAALQLKPMVSHRPGRPGASCRGASGPLKPLLRCRASTKHGRRIIRPETRRPGPTLPGVSWEGVADVATA